ncbi:MAG: 3-deoxy-7-phosphoheptulonate synthase [Candidatus Desulforudis sp.]|nr:3-deoxy-7-phosphoheptulonate synthase [Desulforudis sp.]
MVIVMSHKATDEQIEAVMKRLKEKGFRINLSRGVERTVIGAIGDETMLGDAGIELLPGVDKVIPILRPYKLASRIMKEEGTVIRIGDVEIGGGTVQVMAGPCAVESKEQLFEAAEKVKQAGARILRGGAYKPRTSPYSFQGMAEKGLQLLAETREKYGLLIVTEVMDPRSLPLVVEYADIVQIGTRNMQNFWLLREVGQCNKPVLLKRGLSATIEEWLMAAEYILSEGNPNVILCERGVRTFESYTRNTLDLSAVPVIKHLSHLPIIVDPSHALGKYELVPSMAVAAVAAGADGLLIEVHPNPQEALCDGAQSLTPKKFGKVMVQVGEVARAIGKKV